MPNKPHSPDTQLNQSFLINDQGEEIPITDEMINHSMSAAKLQSIGVHTGFQKVISDEILVQERPPKK